MSAAELSRTFGIAVVAASSLIADPRIVFAMSHVDDGTRR
jgi:hypothetical protein